MIGIDLEKSQETTKELMTLKKLGGKNYELYTATSNYMAKIFKKI